MEDYDKKTKPRILRYISLIALDLHGGARNPGGDTRLNYQTRRGAFQKILSDRKRKS